MLRDLSSKLSMHTANLKIATQDTSAFLILSLHVAQPWQVIQAGTLRLVILLALLGQPPAAVLQH